MLKFYIREDFTGQRTQVTEKPGDKIMGYRDKGALCVEMEGVGLFTIANYRKCVATGIYVVSDVYSEDDWNLGWEGNDIKRAVGVVIDMIIESIR